MPKIKTHKATSKRFRRSKGGKGKLMRPRAGQGHFRRKHSKASKRLYYQMTPVDNKGLRTRVRRLMPTLGRISFHKHTEDDDIE